ncbi:radical SAM/SPASM domain-containing protein [Heliophilum fasciatum]|uniref:MoaA/NifB/PqqE/SkfB family radical SAM enzyme n=1 Tax=Heliophilum fasciatum TaxID=35700 RepID=A0A4R2RME5_9FIRM|nr:radical SAM/SPASM domain-containing protein [Heliophilum fasciatum]MCW2278806.1 MoaA/NifB/PqqE/SkfB family radical SAM enzyme [Heliophilum fasciatum]TCP64108.1 MoaA/NifB/PqqE/SkfB family radical SAM enzyme [Heliophilum fasciatum]
MAIIKPSFDNKRQNLRDIIPLHAPFHIGIEPTRLCNSRCFFCQHSTRGDDDDLFVKKGQLIQHMNFELYKKIINDIMDLPEQPKKIQLAGMGEPILNPELGKMIRYLRSAGFTGRISTYTNGIALTPELAEELADSGLTSLQVSVYGITGEDFKNLAGISVDMDQYIENIRYIFEHKKTVQIRLKTTDDVVTTEAKRKAFFDMFDDICDQIFVEHIINIPNQMGRDRVKARNITQYSEELECYRDICPWMFYQAHINIDGDVFFCDILAKPKEFAIGNIKDSSLVSIWNGAQRRELLCTGLKSGQDAITQCVGCEDRFSMTAPEEYLDDCREELLERLKQQ